MCPQHPTHGSSEAQTPHLLLQTLPPLTALFQLKELTSPLRHRNVKPQPITYLFQKMIPTFAISLESVPSFPFLLPSSSFH